MPHRPEFPLWVYYDGSCSICATEIEHYLRMDRSGHLRPVDISASDFAPPPLGILLAEFTYQLHAVDQAGRIYRGVEAFWAIWQAFPSSTLYGLLGTLLMLPGFNAVARGGYWGFARIRRYLPKRRHDCTAGSCPTDRRGG